MDSFVSRLLFLLLTILVVLVRTSSVDVQSQRLEESGEMRRSAAVRRHRSPPRKTPENAIRRQIERVKEKILSQLSYSVRTAPVSGSARASLPQPLLHMYDIDIAGQGAESVVVGTDTRGWSSQGVQARRDRQQQSKYKQARLIVFGHKSK